jgi:hypothetical protein
MLRTPSWHSRDIWQAEYGGQGCRARNFACFAITPLTSVITTLAPRDSPPANDAAAAGIDGRGRALYQGTTAAEGTMVAGDASWEVHATVDEPVELLCAFVAHYRALGAARVHLALDRPTEETVESLRRIDGVRLTLCDAGHWRRLAQGRRPDNPVRRQILNAGAAYRETACDWFLFCDADEFVHACRPIGEILGGLPRDAPLARLRVAERAFLSEPPPTTIFEGAFRLQAGLVWPPPRPAGAAKLGRLARRVLDRLTGGPRAGLAAVYGDGRTALLNDAGLLGHGAGKSFTRRGQALAIGIHHPLPEGRAGEDRGFLDEPAWRRHLEAAVLLHFDGLTVLHWQLKLLRKYAAHPAAGIGAEPGLGRRTEARKAQIRAVHAARGDAAALARLMDGLVVLSPAQAAALVRARLAAAIDPGIAAAVARAYGPAAPDLSPAAFDRRLRGQHAELIARMGFAG